MDAEDRGSDPHDADADGPRRGARQRYGPLPHEATGDRDRRQRLLRAPATTVAAGVAGGLLLAEALRAIGGRVQGLILIVVISLFLSFAMEPAVQWFARRGIRRGFGTWIVFLGIILATVGMVAAIVPLVTEQVSNLFRAAPRLLTDLANTAGELLPGDTGTDLQAWLAEQARELPNQLPDVAGDLGRGVLGLGTTLLGGVFQLATIGLVTFYLVADGPKLRARLARRLPPRDQVRVLGLWEMAIAKTGGYVYTRVLTAVVSTIFHVVVFALIGLDYGVALGIWVGVISSLIPVVGTYLAGALPVVVGLASSPGLALGVLVAVTIYQQIENYLVVPRITKQTLELHPAVAFMAVLGGGAVAGATGALLALPAAAIVAALWAASGEEYDVLEHSLLESHDAAADLVEQAASWHEDRSDTAPGPERRRRDRRHTAGEPPPASPGGPYDGDAEPRRPTGDDPPPADRGR